ncbi:STR8 [Symbiodinium natans]|uniref:STR8 protein n=1 Tax=Symbiodinium natans TaxID=878477 RepID=A0A812Q9Y2_9DINO|nr:STR8 [Symbiodinium natans]
MFDLQRKRILVSTILRDPVERIRSWYYYWAVGQSHTTFLDWLQFRRDFVSGNWTQAGLEAQSHEPNFAATLSTFHMSCCEYEVYLGQGSVERAKVALATQFDLVGITERMSDSIVSLGKLYGKTAEEMAQIGQHIGKDLENSRKLDWTDEEKSLATYIANKSPGRPLGHFTFSLSRFTP